MIEVIQELYDIGLNGTEKYIEPKLTVKADTSETILDELDARYKPQVFNVEGNCEFEEYEVLFDVSNLPQGTKITNEDGVEKTKFDSEEKFKVMIPVEENGTTSFEIQVKAKLKSMPVYQAECDNIRMQTMLITANPYETVVTDVAVKLNKITTSIKIVKRDSVTNEKLGNATFEVTKVDGEIIGTFVTDNNGEVEIKVNESGYYKIKELEAPDGYLLADNAGDNEQIILVEFDKENIVTFLNDKKAGLEIIKRDSVTDKPLANATFSIKEVGGSLIGEYTTDRQGHINLPDLDSGWYTILEIEAPKGYILDDVKKDVEVTGYKNQIVEFTNRAKAGLQILKVDSVTKQGLKDVKFKVSKINGEVIVTYKTDASGMIYLYSLDEGWYIVQEVSTINGYKIDTTPRNVEVKSNVATVVEFENIPYSTLIIEKIDSVTSKTIEGVKFYITKENGEYVGDFATDSFGQIKLSKTLNTGTYIVTETTALDGYKLDTTTYKVTLGVGETKLLQVKNLPYGSLKITKTDKDTKEALKGVEYVLISEDGANKWELVTDKNGEINISKELEEGIYYLTETKSLNGYVKDNKEYKIEIKWGKTTTLNLTNEKIKGKIQVIKTSTDNNQLTGVLANTRFSNAVFEIRNEKGKLIETITTNYNGVATSKALEYGTYIVKEVKAPENYILDANEYTVVIKDGQTRVLNITNKSVKVDVTIEKTGW